MNFEGTYESYRRRTEPGTEPETFTHKGHFKELV